MAKVAAFPREIAIPAGFPKARVSAVMRRAQDAVEAVKAVGETVASVEISPEGAVKVLTVAGAKAAPVDRGEWD